MWRPEEVLTSFNVFQFGDLSFIQHLVALAHRVPYSRLNILHQYPTGVTCKVHFWIQNSSTFVDDLSNLISFVFEDRFGFRHDVLRLCPLPLLFWFTRVISKLPFTLRLSLLINRLISFIVTLLLSIFLDIIFVPLVLCFLLFLVLIN